VSAPEVNGKKSQGGGKMPGVGNICHVAKKTVSVGCFVSKRIIQGRGGSMFRLILLGRGWSFRGKGGHLQKGSRNGLKDEEGTLRGSPLQVSKE